MKQAKLKLKFRILWTVLDLVPFVSRERYRALVRTVEVLYRELELAWKRADEERFRAQKLARGLEAILQHERYVASGSTPSDEPSDGYHPRSCRRPAFWVDLTNEAGTVWRIFDHDLEAVVSGALRFLSPPKKLENKP